MTSIPLVIKPRRFRVTLWSLVNKWTYPTYEAEQKAINEAKQANKPFQSNDTYLAPGAELDEIVSFSTSYAINRIPTATVIPAHGLELHTNNPSKILVNLNKMIKEKAPVGICVELVEDQQVPQFATTSATNNSDPDREKWPQEKVFIFKGYVTGCSIQRSGASVSTQIHLRHWLQDMSLLCMYSPRSHTSAPYSFAADLARVGITNPENTFTGWNLDRPADIQEVLDDTNKSAVDERGNPVTRPRTLYDCALYAVNAVIEAGLAQMDDCAYGKVDRDYYKKQENALKHLLSQLEYTDDARAALKTLINEVTASIDNTGADSWVTATAWDKLCGHYGQLYYYAFAPTAGKCHVIPTPSCIADEDKILTLTSNELTSIQYTEPVAPPLGGVVLANEAIEGENSYGESPQYDPIVYPPQKVLASELKNSVGGPLTVVKLPSYLQSNGTVAHPPIKIQQIEITDEPKVTVRPDMEEARKHIKESNDAIDILSYELVRLHYLSQVFAGRRLTVSTGFRGDIVPGECIHIHIDPVMENNPADAAIDLYGTVEYVTVEAAVNDHMSTNIVLNNIRNADEYKSMIYNPDDIPFYKTIFAGLDATLYCPF